MAFQPADLSAQFTQTLAEQRIALEDISLNYLSSMLARMSTDPAPGAAAAVGPDVARVRAETEMVLEEAELSPTQMNAFYEALGMKLEASRRAFAEAEAEAAQKASQAASALSSAPVSERAKAAEARKQKRLEKKKAKDPVAAPTSITTSATSEKENTSAKASANADDASRDADAEPTIVATSQQSRFHKETLVTSSREVDLATVNIAVNQLDLLLDAHLRLKEGVRYGLVGQNGVGKSVLMKCMADGILALPNNLNVLHVAQLEVFDEALIVVDEVLHADKASMASIQEYEDLHRILGNSRQSTAQNNAELNKAVHSILLTRLSARVAAARQIALKRSGQRGHEARQEQLKVENEHAALGRRDPQTFVTSDMVTDMIADVFDRYELVDVEGRRARAKRILKGLGFLDAQVDEPVKKLSGGWRMKVALAKSLFMSPDILLLDEPTNHLDLPAIFWLQEYIINETDGITVVVVSHDRSFLNAVTNETIILRDKVLAYHVGNFDDYEKNSEEQRVRKQALLDTQEKKRAKIVASIQHNVQQARATGDDKRLGQVASRKKKLDRLGMEKTEDGKRFKVSYWAGHHAGARADVEVQKAVRTAPIRVPEPAPLRYHGQVFTAKNVSFKYPKSARMYLKDVSIDVKPGARIAFLGPNGCGKTTLLNVLTGVLPPTAGEVYRHASLRIGYFSQHAVDGLDPARTPLQEMRRRHPAMSEQACWAQFGGVGIVGGVASRRTASLSGGQRSRVALAMVLVEEPHVLVLDEITNHLDMGTVDKLVDALRAFSGALVLVSHDVWFLRELMEGDEEGGEEEEELEAPRERAFYVVRNGLVTRWEKDLDAYVDTVMAKVRKSF